MSQPFEQSEKHILIIEDDNNYLEQTKNALELEGYRVTTATNGTDGWNFLQANPIDLVVLDLIMPGQDGVWFLEMVRNSQQFAKLPVVVFTNLSHGEKIGKAVVLGVSRLLIKGQTPMSEISQMIKEVLSSV